MGSDLLQKRINSLDDLNNRLESTYKRIDDIRNDIKGIYDIEINSIVELISVNCAGYFDNMNKFTITMLKDDGDLGDNVDKLIKNYDEIVSVTMRSLDELEKLIEKLKNNNNG